MEALGQASMSTEEPFKNVREQATLTFTFNQESQGILWDTLDATDPVAVCGKEQTKFGTAVHVVIMTVCFPRVSFEVQDHFLPI